jgi:chromate transport protein ChrA
MTDEVYGELFALGQFMPGPTSTQVSFAVGIVKKGVKGESAAAADVVGSLITANQCSSFDVWSFC